MKLSSHCARFCFVSSLVILLSAVLEDRTVMAQMPGGGAGAGAPGTPAFVDPKFRDRVWEAGGPRLSGPTTMTITNAATATATTIYSHNNNSTITTTNNNNNNNKQCIHLEPRSHERL